MLRSEVKELSDRSNYSLQYRYNNHIKNNLAGRQQGDNPTVPANEPEPEQEMTAGEAPGQANDEILIEAPVVAQPSGDPPGENPTNERTNGPQQDDPFELFKQQFSRYYRQAFDSKAKRMPLKKPKKQIPPTLIEWVNQLIYEGMSKGPNQIDRLSALVYASGQTIYWFMELKYGEMNQGQANNWRSELTQRIDSLEEVIHWLTQEIDRRINREPLDRRAANTRARNKGTVAQLTAIRHDLNIKISLMRDKLRVRSEEADRKHLRKLSPRFALAKREMTDTPVDETRDYWESIIGKTVEFKISPELEQWADSVKRDRAVLQELGIEDQQKLFLEVCQKARPWKAPGPDGIQNFWWKYIPAAKEHLLQWILKVRSGEIRPQKWISTGRIVLLYKSGDPGDPGNYRPIACLNTCYKFLTGMLTRWMLRYIEAANIIPPEQVAMRKGDWGCTHAHILDRAVTLDARLNGKKPLSMAWIDFSKAFDSVSHKYLRWALKQIGIPEDLRLILSSLMKNWVVKYQGCKDGRIVMSQRLEVRNGVLQGDTLSPLLFCIAISPISYWLTKNITKYETSFGKIGGYSVKLGHLYYMDDLKVYTTSPQELDRALNGVESIGLTIGLKTNAKKCAAIHLNNRDPLATRGFMLDKIPLIGEQNSYKYLGIAQNSRISQHEVLGKLKEVVCKQATAIWSSKLTFGQKVQNTNSQVMTKANYVFQNMIVGAGRFESTIKYAKQLDSALITILRSNEAKFQATSKERYYLDRDKGGLGLQTFEETLERATAYAWSYLNTKPELQNAWKIFYNNDAKRTKRSVVSDMRFILSSDLYKEANAQGRILRENAQPIVTVDGIQYRDPTLAARAICDILHKTRQATYLDKWKGSPLQGRVLNNPDLDLDHSLRWMAKGHVGARVMQIILSAQEGMLVTKEFKRSHYGRTNGLCRMRCHVGSQRPAQTESIQHIVSCCPHWRSGLMLQRHNAVARVIHWYMCREWNLGTYHYSQTPNPVMENDRAALYWDHSIPTERPLKHNRPDIVLVDKEHKSIYIIEIRVSWPSSLLKEERRKVIKYAVNSNLEEEFDITQNPPAGDNLLCELQRVYRGYTCRMLPIVTGVFGETSNNTLAYLQEARIPLKDAEALLERMSRAAAIGTYRVILAHTANPEEATAHPTRAQ